MIWKFWFVFGSIAYTLLTAFGLADPYMLNNLGEAGYISGLLVSFTIVISLGYFFALGWKKKLIPNKFNKVFIIIFLLPLATVYINSIYTYYYTLLQNLILPRDALKLTFLFSAIYMVVILTFYSPVIVALIKYNKRINELEMIDKPLWKIFVILCLFNFISFLVSGIINYIKHPSGTYNLWDMYSTLIGVYNTFFLIGFAYKKKFFSQMFWKISSVVYTIVFIPSILFTSPQFKIDAMYYTELYSWWSFIVFTSILFLYCLYTYSFTGIVFKGKETN